MARLGKKILSVFVENVSTSQPVASTPAQEPVTGTLSAAGAPPGLNPDPAGNNPTRNDTRFVDYFDKLFRDANIPGPDYYEFSRMIEAMQAIPDEQSRFYTAFAGLRVQGLDKTKLLSTAGDYLRVLASDADHFRSTVETALQTKVNGKVREAEEKGERIRALAQEIESLKNQIAALQSEIGDNREKIGSSNSGYTAESERRKTRIEADIEKIKNYIQ
jgi:hypothetical protein